MSQMTLHQRGLDSVQVDIDWLLQGRKGPQTLPRHLQEDSDHEMVTESASLSTLNQEHAEESRRTDRSAEVQVGKP